MPLRRRCQEKGCLAVIEACLVVLSRTSLDAHGRTGYVKSRRVLRGFLRGALETIRTSDLFLRREALYPAELRVPVLGFGTGLGLDS